MDLDIHFIHVRSKNPNALPVIITHGWPGSIIEQLKIIDPLTNPTAHGGKAEEAFDVVIPSLPGYGYSGQADNDRLGPDSHGAGLGRADETPRLHEICRARRRLGQRSHRANGAARAAGIGRHPHQHACHRPGRHRQGGFCRCASAIKSLGEEKHAYDQLSFFYKHGLGYAKEMANRPQTLYALADSPVGLAAWMLDHDGVSMALMSRVFDGQPEGLTRDDVLDNITYYWFTNTAVSSARFIGKASWPSLRRKASPSPQR